MKDIVLYVYSSDKEFSEWLQFLLSKVKATISVCQKRDELEKLYKKHLPDILLIDDNDKDEMVEGSSTKKKSADTAESEILYILEHIVPRRRRGSSMVAVLSTHASDIEYKVDILLNGADYIIDKPLNMVELIARVTAMVRHQRYVQETISNYISQTRDLVAFDAMDKILMYLNEHIKPIIQAQIDQKTTVDAADSSARQEYLDKTYEDSIEIMAAINAIKDDVHELMISHQSDKPGEYDHLNKLFKKNLDLIHTAYKGTERR